MKKRLLAGLLSLVLAISLLPVAAFATEEPETDAPPELHFELPEIDLNLDNTDGTIVGFDSQEWYVVGDDTNGVHPVDGHITLLHKLDYTKATDPIYVFDYGSAEEQEAWYDWFENNVRYGGSEFRNYRFLPQIDGEYPEFQTYSGQTYALYKKSDGQPLLLQDTYTGQKHEYALYFAVDKDAAEGTRGWTNPCDYSGSTLQHFTDEIISNLMNPREVALITTRDLTSADGMSGKDALNQHLWHLSEQELKTCLAAAKNYYTSYWLRTPYQNDPTGVQCYVIGNYYNTQNPANFLYYNGLYWSDGYFNKDGELIMGGDLSSPFRPTFNLDLENAIFATTASGERGKTSTVSGNLSEMQDAADLLTDDDPIKFTMKDHAVQTLSIDNEDLTVQVSDGKGAIRYSNAATGDNQYISCFVADRQGNIVSYGKLAKVDNASGEITLTQISEELMSGEHTMFLYSEQDNGDNYTDFAGEMIPVEFESVTTVKPVELTKYIADDHDETHVGNCFPDPRYEGIPAGAEIKVQGKVWDVEAEGGYPFTINYYEKNEDGSLTPLTDDHKPGTYVARIEALLGGSIPLNQVTINGSNIKTQDNVLHIRGISGTAGEVDIEKIASAVVTEAPKTEVSSATAVIPADTEYLVNNISGQKPNPDADIRLLHDELLTSDEGADVFMDAMQKRLEEVKNEVQLVKPDSNRVYAMKYLDLIDANDSNLLVCAQGEYQIILPYPDGTGKDTEFQLFRFDNLNRTYTEADASDGALENINDTNISEVEIEKTDAGIKFTVPATWVTEDNYSIGAMALTWIKKTGGGGGGGTTYYTLSYDSNGGTTYQDERYASQTTVTLSKTPIREGYTFTGWYADKDLTEKITEVKMTGNKTVYAGWEPTDVPDWLNGDDHFAYVVGYPDGNVRPNGQITRAEVATIFFRLLKEEIREENLTTSNAFADVNGGMWHNTAVSTMAKLGILKGRTADTFVPDAPITRAEFAAICARFDTGLDQGTSNFTDLNGHWAKTEIERAVSLGWIMGYEDNTFRPDNLITRAEAMTMINRVLNRLPEGEDDLLDGMNVWPDNQPGTWYYLAVQEATNSHDFDRKGDVHERWTKLTADPDWTKYQT